MNVISLLKWKTIALLRKLKRPAARFWHLYIRKDQNAWVYLPQKKFAKKTDADFLNSIIHTIEKMPVSNGGRYYQKHEAVIGVVADEFLFDSIKDAANFRFLLPDEWESAIDGIDMLLIASAWKGIGEEWRGAAKEGNEKRRILYQIIDQCKQRGITTVFYSKEDPPNYQYFLGLAQKCDYIFTTCLEVTENYRNDCANERVDVLKFGINPLFHNPVGMRSGNKREGVIFSGSWMNKYPERQVDMKTLLDGVCLSGVPLKIVDRNYDRLPASFRYPPEYWKYLSPAIEHDLLQKVHKLYDFSLNINTVKGSRTMFANRGYELQANGNLLLSNYSCGVNEQLPTVIIGHSKEDVSDVLRALSPEDAYERQIMGVREMMTGNTCFDRIGQVLETVGLKGDVTKRKILVVANELTDHVQAMFDRQSYPWKELVRCSDVTQEIYERSDMIAFFDDGMEYEMFYLEDMINAFKYTDSSYVTKAAYYADDALVQGVEHDYISTMGSKYRTVFWREDFAWDVLSAMGENQSLANGYSIDHFNYNAMAWNSVERDQDDKVLTVLIPVNAERGTVPYVKAFSSVFRSSVFDKLSVVFVLDPAAGEHAANMMESIARRYGNVRVHVAKAVEDAVADISTPYVYVLKAEYESIHDGLKKMYDCAVSSDADMVFADVLVYRQGTVEIRKMPESIAQMNDEEMDIHACLLKSELVRDAQTFDLRALTEKAKKISRIDSQVCAEYMIEQDGIC